MLSILLLSQRGEGYAIANKLIQEGHIVKCWVQRPEEVNWPMHERLQQIDRYEEHIQTSDLCVCLTSGIGGLAEELRKRRKLVVGGAVQDLLVGQGTLQDTALTLMNIPRTTESSDQCLTLSGWFNGKEFTDEYITQRYCRLLENDRGPDIGGMGCLTWQDNSLLSRVSPILQTSGYRGFVGVKVDIRDNQLYFESFDFGLTEELISSIVECARAPLASLLLATAAQRVRNVTKERLFGISVKLLDFGGVDPKVDCVEAAAKHYWPNNSKGYLGCVSARGVTPQEARRRVYRTISNITTPDVVYRRDIGCNSLWEWVQDAEVEVVT